MDSIFEKITFWATRHPHKLLFSFLDVGGRETESYTYEAFLKRAKAISSHLRSECGFKTNDRLLLAYPPGLEIICAFFGCAHAGLIPVPVYPPTKHGFKAAFYKMVRIAKDCDATGVLTDGTYYRSINSAIKNNCGSEDLDALYVSNLNWIATDNMREPTSDEAFGSGDVLFLQYTSGSTGDPKGVMVSHANILHNASLVTDHAEPIAVSWLPQYHDMGLIGYYLYSALAGGTTYGFSPTSFIQRPALWFETITSYRASASSAPNFAFEYCLRSDRLSEVTLAKADLSSLRFLMTAAEPVRAATYLRFKQAFSPYGLKPEHFFVAYGLAENTLAATSHGRNVLSVNKNALALQRVRTISEVSEIATAKQIVSCGIPLRDVVVKIVDSEKHLALEEGNVGEVWLSGQSKCLGYWNKPELTEQTFHARIIGDAQDQRGYLRTGDAGFLFKNELYICGRTKDMIIIRGQNYYPQDIEAVVEDASDLIRGTCVVAFEIEKDNGSALAVVAEVKSRNPLPDPSNIINAIRRYLGLETSLIVFLPPKAIPKTSSGKLMRGAAKRMWLDGEFDALQHFSYRTVQEVRVGNAKLSPLQPLKSRYGLRGNEPYSLIDAGVDSLDLVVFVHEIKELLKGRGADELGRQVNIDLIQNISIAKLFFWGDLFERSPEAAVIHVKRLLSRLSRLRRRDQERRMSRDRTLVFTARVNKATHKRAHGILLVGGTGFLGPFLMRSLVEQSDHNIYVLLRASDETSGKARLRAALEETGPFSASLKKKVEDRVIPVCGDLRRARLGQSEVNWRFLAENIGTIYHSAAAVNYLFNYESLRPVNVAGTNEILRLAFEGAQKDFNYVSTTFIFGWSVKEVLYETDSNDKMASLDFGYSQSKWTAEQIVLDAARHGLDIRIFRPALITPSVTGGGSNLDIAIRLFAFMINHGIGVDALNQVSLVPADVVANNIVAISCAPTTLGATYHVTRDEYSNMTDITDIIARLTGRPFQLFKLRHFVPEVIRRCTRDDLLFPLIDFLVGSIDSIASMEFKRYDSSNYQNARDASRSAVPDPSLEDTVLGILRFMRKKALIGRFR